MAFQDVVFLAVCALTWLILLPALLVGGALTLVLSAVSELRELFFGRPTMPDTTTAREMARRMCLLP
jgi:hypothetical protein